MREGAVEYFKHHLGSDQRIMRPFVQKICQSLLNLPKRGPAVTTELKAPPDELLQPW